MRKHFNDYLQHAFNKYGEHCFNYSVVAMVHRHELDSREIEWIKRFDTCNHEYGYNILEGGLGKSDVPLSIRRKISKALTGKKRSPESIEKSAAGHRGQKRSEQTRRNMSGRRPSLEERARLSVVQKGKVISPETRKKISETLKKQSDILRERATGVIPSEETRRKISLKLKGRKHDPATIAKRAASGIGRKLSVETKAKISAFHKGNKWNLGQKRSEVTRKILSEKATLREARKRQAREMSNA